MPERIDKINDAIHECLERCYCADSPIACMAAYLEGLQRDPRWRLAEVNLVERRVRQILTLIVEPSPADRLSA